MREKCNVTCFSGPCSVKRWEIKAFHHFLEIKCNIIIILSFLLKFYPAIHSPKTFRINHPISAETTLFLQKWSLSAEMLSFCRNDLFLQKGYLSAERLSFCRKALFLQKGISFCRLRLSAETFCFLHTFFRFLPSSFRLISSVCTGPF